MRSSAQPDSLSEKRVDSGVELPGVVRSLAAKKRSRPDLGPCAAGASARAVAGALVIGSAGTGRGAVAGASPAGAGAGLITGGAGAGSGSTTGSSTRSVLGSSRNLTSTTSVLSASSSTRESLSTHWNGSSSVFGVAASTTVISASLA